MHTLVGSFHVDLSQRELFKSGELWNTWAKAYPQLFDADDIRIAETQAKLGYHYYEWLASILLFHTSGYLSLLEQYQYTNHPRKREIVKRLLPPELIDFISHRRPPYVSLQCPDLLAYAPDFSDWYFCEVKGPADHLRPEQEAYFQKLESESGKEIRIIQFCVPTKSSKPASVNTNGEQ